MRKLIAATAIAAVLSLPAYAGGTGGKGGTTNVYSPSATNIYKPSATNTFNPTNTNTNTNVFSPRNTNVNNVSSRANSRANSNSNASATVVNSVSSSAGALGGPLGMIAGSVVGALLVNAIQSNNQPVVVAAPRRSYAARPTPTVIVNVTCPCCPTQVPPVPVYAPGN